jgi:hypothetical protein
MATATTPNERRLTHVELLYRPGERQLAARVFALLGCTPVDRGGKWFTAFIEPSGVGDYAQNVFYASEMTGAQGELEQAFLTKIGTERESYLALMRAQPQLSTHFGFRVPDEAALQEVVERVRLAAASDNELEGRIALDHIYRPDDPDAVAPGMIQAFVWTDVVAAGLLSCGQHFEVQVHLEGATGRQAG